MAHGGYGKRRVVGEANNRNRRPKSSSLGVDKKSKPKAVSIKNQIRSVERMLRKDLPPEVREVQKQKLEELKKQQELQNRLAVERKIFLRNRKVKFFDRRKIERRIRRLEKQQRTSSCKAQETEAAEQLAKLKEDLEYVRFFPKNEKYVSLFSGGDEQDIVDKRCKLREQIKANIVAAAASGKDLEETGSEDDGLLDLSDDDFFESGSSSDEADDEWTDKSAREQASSASGKAASSMSSDEKNQRQISARALMPPPRPSSKSFSHSANKKSRFGASTSKKPFFRDMSTSSNTSDSINRSTFRKGRPADSLTGNSGNISSNSDARKPRERVLEDELEKFARAGIRISIIGDTSMLHKSLQELIDKAVKTTKENSQLHVVIAVNYSGQYDVVQACQTIAQKVKDGIVEPEDISSFLVEQELQTNCTDFPCPDLLIRTSGELRLSNFLLWQLAYAELFFSHSHWPDFGEAEFLEALCSFQQRQRRYGSQGS